MVVVTKMTGGGGMVVIEGIKTGMLVAEDCITEWR